MAIVEDPAELDGKELVTQRTDVPVQSQSFQIDMGSTKNGGSRGLIASSGLDANESILDDIDTANTMLPGQIVQGGEDFDTISVGFSVCDYNFDGKSTLEFDGKSFRGLRRVFGGYSEFPHVCRWGGVGIFKNARLVRDVEQVLVGRPGLSSGLGDRDGFFCSECEKSLTSRKSLVEFYAEKVLGECERAPRWEDSPGSRHGAITLMSGLRP